MDWNEKRKEIESALKELIESSDEFTYANVETFREAGVLSGSSGLLLRVGNGVEFQIRIVRSR